MCKNHSLLIPQAFSNQVLVRNGKLGEDACKIMAAAIKAVNPYNCVQQHCQLVGSELNIGHNKINLEKINRAYVIGFGKASVPMAKALIDILGNRIALAHIITKDERFLAENGYKHKLHVYLGGHPIPTEESINATQKLLDQLPTLTNRDLVLVVISGGGSALFTSPVKNVSLEDLQQLTQGLLNSGADINEINTLRKHLDQVKGGRLALRLQPAAVHALILSDVIGDRLDMIASGPTVPDSTSFGDSLSILEKYDLLEMLPQSIIEYLKQGQQGDNSEPLKPAQFSSGNVINHLVGTNILAAEAARIKAQQLGYSSLIISSNLTGLTKDITIFLEGIIQTEVTSGHPVKHPACLIFGGEPTVEVVGDGLGGRNQDLVLRMVKGLRDKDGVIFISLATDGEDGPTDAAGAATDGQAFYQGETIMGLSIDSYINSSNSYHFFRQVGGLVKTGSTGTNVNDLVIIMFDGKKSVFY